MHKIRTNNKYEQMTNIDLDIIPTIGEESETNEK